MKCPHCNVEIPDAVVSAEAGRIASAKVVDKRGRKAVLRRCKRCGRVHSAREMRKCKV